MFFGVFKQVLQSRLLQVSLTICYLLTIVYSYFELPPATDDMFYFWGALNYYHTGTVGMLEGDVFATTYFQFPVYSIVNGLFLHIMNFIGVSLDAYSYRLFSKILLVMLLFFSIYYVRMINGKNATLASNLLIIIITLSPFTIGSIGVVRPEALGMLFLLIGLIFYSKWLKDKLNPKISNVFMMCFFFGSALVVHPSFVIISACITLTILFRLSQSYPISKIFMFTVTVLMPFFVLSLWYLGALNESLMDLTNRTIIKTDDFIFSTFLENIKRQIINIFVFENRAIFLQLYRVLFNLPFILFVLVLLRLIVSYVIKGALDSHNYNILIIGFLSSLINLFILPMYDFHYLPIIFLMSYLLPALLITDVIEPDKLEHKDSLIISK
jgi:hypothetical protein